ncbi:hypothetical protein EVAR_35994_1 [Eumeta japonica]|uniref:Uncharacterized protein n=1 Tax=Eumeta variegata TaxID=151549 RepID=A0A4C1WWE1_EUMVA|nr:hypothetical protein EVAR_35994_1 [Eumeta japonica]
MNVAPAVNIGPSTRPRAVNDLTCDFRDLALPDATGQLSGVLKARDLPCGSTLKGNPSVRKVTGTLTRVGPICVSRRGSNPTSGRELNGDCSIVADPGIRKSVRAATTESRRFITHWRGCDVASL